MNILDNETSDVIVWLPHGRGFVINNKKRLESEILPTYFNHDAKFTSFKKILNNTEKIFLVVVTVLKINGSKLEMV